jgi:arginase
VVHIGCRDDDDHLAEVRGLLGAVIPASAVTAGSAREAAAVAAGIAGRGVLAGYWLHVDVDVLDPSVLPAVDSPAAGGLSVADLTGLLQALAPGAVGAQVTVFDPDLDPDGRYARLLTEILVEGLSGLGTDRVAACPEDPASKGL